jgi:hypothetical protein
MGKIITNGSIEGRKNYLYSIHPEVWQVICDGVDFLDEDEQPTSYHRNDKQSLFSPHQWTRKNSTVWIVWMWPKIFGPLSEWHMKVQSL